MSVGTNGNPALVFKGNEKAQLAVGFQDAERDFPYISLADREGRKRMSLGLGVDEATICLYDGAGSPAVTIDQSRDNGGSWSLARSPTRAFVQSYVWPDGQARLEIADKEGDVVTELPGPLLNQAK